MRKLRQPDEVIFPNITKWLSVTPKLELRPPKSKSHSPNAVVVWLHSRISSRDFWNIWLQWPFSWWFWTRIQKTFFFFFFRSSATAVTDMVKNPCQNHHISVSLNVLLRKKKKENTMIQEIWEMLTPPPAVSLWENHNNYSHFKDSERITIIIHTLKTLRNNLINWLPPRDSKS